MTSFDSLSRSQKVRAALHKDVRALCAETCHFLGLEITKPAMEVIAELVFKKVSVYGLDLEAFAKHAKRATINAEDVKLLARRNPSLKSHLQSIAVQAPNSTIKEKKRKTVTPSVKSSATAKSKDVFVEPITNDAVKDDPIKKPDLVESMVIDDTIDLTFD